MVTLLWVVFCSATFCLIILNFIYVEMRRILRGENIKVSDLKLLFFPYKPFRDLIKQGNIKYSDKKKCVQLYKTYAWLKGIVFVCFIALVVIVIFGLW
jgi:hypothetical protein